MFKLHPSSVVTALALIVLPVSAAAQTLNMLTEDYPPFGFERDGQIVGTSVDQVRRIMDTAYPDYEIRILPWARAYATAETDASTCVFSTTMLPERLPRFQWVEPLSVDIMMLVRRAGTPFQARTLAEAKTFSIAVHHGDSAEIYAMEQQFPKLDRAPSLELSLKKLLAGRVEMMIMTRSTFDGLLAEGTPVEAVLDLQVTRSGIACNPGVADETIAAMQDVLRKMIADGTQASILKRYEKPIRPKNMPP